jgi:hypothetical protein
MGQNDDSFRLKTLIFCLVIFLLVSMAHVLAMYVQTEQNIQLLQKQIDNMHTTQPWNIGSANETILKNNMLNQTKVDALSILGSFFAITLGFDLPMPMPIVLSIFNVVMLISISYVVASIIRSYIPFVSG